MRGGGGSGEWVECTLVTHKVRGQGIQTHCTSQVKTILWHVYSSSHVDPVPLFLLQVAILCKYIHGMGTGVVHSHTSTHRCTFTKEHKVHIHA